MELKKLRLITNLTQSEMAEKLNISQSAYAKLEGGKTYTTIDILNKLLEIFPLEACDILSTRSRKISIIVHSNQDELPFKSIRELLEDWNEKGLIISHLENLLEKEKEEKNRIEALYFKTILSKT